MRARQRPHQHHVSSILAETKDMVWAIKLEAMEGMSWWEWTW